MNIEKLPFRNAFFIALYISMPFSNALAIFFLQPDLFWALDFFRIAIISVGLAIPLMLFSIPLGVYSYGESGDAQADDRPIFYAYGFGAFLCVWCFNSLLVVCYFTKCTLKDFYIFLLLLHVALFLVMLFINSASKKKAKQRLKNNNPT